MSDKKLKKIASDINQILAKNNAYFFVQFEPANIFCRIFKKFIKFRYLIILRKK